MQKELWVFGEEPFFEMGNKATVEEPKKEAINNVPKFMTEMPIKQHFKIHIAIDFGTDGMGMFIIIVIFCLIQCIDAI